MFFNAANPAVAVGDLIQVTGAPGEFQGQTQLSATAAANYTVIEAGAGVPAMPSPLPDTVLGSAREAFEGMLVQPTGSYVLASTHELFNFGSLWLSAGHAAGHVHRGRRCRFGRRRPRSPPTTPPAAS